MLSQVSKSPVHTQIQTYWNAKGRKKHRDGLQVLKKSSKNAHLLVLHESGRLHLLFNKKHWLILLVAISTVCVAITEVLQEFLSFTHTLEKEAPL